jgi:hypothetical protein
VIREPFRSDTLLSNRGVHLPPETGVAAIAHVIQLSIAPVFLLTGVAAMLGVLSNRLARIIDRGRLLEGHAESAVQDRQVMLHRELLVLARRARLVNRAIGLCTLCALLICAVIISLFLGAFLKVDVSNAIGGIFIAALTALSGGLLIFLREITVATRSLRIGPQP